MRAPGMRAAFRDLPQFATRERDRSPEAGRGDMRGQGSLLDMDQCPGRRDRAPLEFMHSRIVVAE